jgi:HEPN domain-containing protein
MVRPANPSREFLRVAKKRQAAAELLVQHGFPTEAVYLAGYAVECGLKAILLECVPRKDRTAFVAAEFRGLRGHNLYNLKDKLRELSVHFPVAVLADFRIVAEWTTDLRYETRDLDLIESREFLAATNRILNWCEQRL